MVPLRHKEIYQSDDGRYVEVYTKINDIEETKEPTEEESTVEDSNEKPEYSTAEKVFVGVAHVPVGPQVKEIKFEIPEATTIEEAFEQYHDIAYGAAQEFMKMLQENMEKQRNKIITADAGALQDIDQMTRQNDGKPTIIV